MVAPQLATHDRSSPQHWIALFRLILKYHSLPSSPRPTHTIFNWSLHFPQISCHDVSTTVAGRTLMTGPLSEYSVYYSNIFVSLRESHLRLVYKAPYTTCKMLDPFGIPQKLHDIPVGTMSRLRFARQRGAWFNSRQGQEFVLWGLGSLKFGWCCWCLPDPILILFLHFSWFIFTICICWNYCGCLTFHLCSLLSELENAALVE
jgi:hypothetical protein